MDIKVSLANPFARCVGSFLTIVRLAQPKAALMLTSHRTLLSALPVMQKLVADKGPRSYISGAAPVIPNKNKAAETLPITLIKPSTKSWANKKRGNILTSSNSTTTDTTSNFMSVSLSVLPQERTSVSMEVDALLDTGSLASDFIAEDIVVRYNLKPVLSDTSYTVCSGVALCHTSTYILTYV